MLVRLALERDVPEIIAMSRAACEETCPNEPFSIERFEKTVRSYFDRADPTFFICEDRARIVGLLAARICEFDYRDGIYTTQRFLYVKPGYRGTRASALLLRELVAWSHRLGAVAVEGGNDNGFQSDRTRKLLEHFGFGFVGFAMRRRLDGQEGPGVQSGSSRSAAG